MAEAKGCDQLIENLRHADNLTADHRILSLTDRAASAIEALQAKVDRLTKENRELAADRPEMEEVNGHWEWRKPNGEVLMPKRGKWELIDGAEPMRWGCSRCKYMSWDTSNYCPRCGAKMNDSNASNASNALNALDNAQDGPIITPCRGCSDYDGYGGCKSKGGCARAKMEVRDADI